jgi:hypothetical protein
MAKAPRSVHSRHPNPGAIAPLDLRLALLGQCDEGGAAPRLDGSIPSPLLWRHTLRHVTSGPTCFLHVPKSAGTSMHVALERALPMGWVAPRRMDRAMLCSFDAIEKLGPEARAVVAADENEVLAMAAHRAISGHFSYATLTRVAAPARIGTVLREPRARLLSHYLYLRLTPGIRETWQPYDPFSPADGSLADFLSDARIATATDNKTCRMLLEGDPRVRDGHFIAAEDLDGIAEAAWECLERLGFVGLLEMGRETWDGLSDLFGVPLTPIELNSTGGDGVRPGALPVPPCSSTEAARRLAADSLAAQRSRFAELASPAVVLTPPGQGLGRRPLHREEEGVAAASRPRTTSAATASASRGPASSSRGSSPPAP